MGRLKKSKYSFNHVVAHWEEVVFRLCDEITPHDVLSQVSNYLTSAIKEAQSFKTDTSRMSRARDLVNQAMTLIDPTH